VTATVKQKTIQQAFEAFHSENPEIYDELVALAREAQAEGATRIGIRMLWEVMRWRRKAYLKADPSQAHYRLNDHYHSRYARLIMEREPDLEGIFEARALRSHGPNRLYDQIPEPGEQGEQGAVL
jgi:hypothetical protein